MLASRLFLASRVARIGLSPTMPMPRARASIPCGKLNVVSKKLAITVHLRETLQPYEMVAPIPKLPRCGFDQRDRGSVVKGENSWHGAVAMKLLRRRAEAQSKLQGAEAHRGKPKANRLGTKSTYEA